MQARHTAPMGRPEVAYARTRQRQQRHQARRDQQCQEEPGRCAGCGQAGAQACGVEQRRQHRKLAHKARQGRQACDQQRTGHKCQTEKRDGPGDGAPDQHFFGLVEVQSPQGLEVGTEVRCVVGLLVGGKTGTVVAPAFNQVVQQKQRAGGQCGAEQVVQRPRRQIHVADSNGGQQGAGRSDDGKPRQVAQALGAQHTNGPKGQREHAAHHQPGATELGRGPGFNTKQQGGQAQDGVHPHLGHDGKNAADRRGGRAVRGHQPEVQRPQGCLGQEGHRQNGCARMQHAAVGVCHLRDLEGHVGHVQGAGDAIQHGHPNQEQRRGHQVDGDVVQPGLHPCAPGAMQHQAVGRRQHDLEEHKQVEQVGREEGPTQAHQLELEQRVVVHTSAVPAGAGEQDGRQPGQAGEHQHHGREPVQRQHNTKGCDPVARQVDPDGGRGFGLFDPQQQCHRDHQAEGGGANVQPHLGFAFFFAQQQHQPAGQHGQQDGGQQQVGHQGLGQPGHRVPPGGASAVSGAAMASASSAPSTWSVPDRPRDAIITTRNSAVMAKPITMAVSTRAWGMGSS